VEYSNVHFNDIALTTKITSAFLIPDVLTKTQKAYNEEDVPEFKDIISFEGRGLAVINFRFGVS